MLIQFSFKNYRSFRNDTVLDLSAAKMTEFNNRVITISGEKILPVAAIYGANASGKSNVYEAFCFMSEYVEKSLHYGDDPEHFDEYSLVTVEWIEPENGWSGKINYGDAQYKCSGNSITPVWCSLYKTANDRDDLCSQTISQLYFV